MLRAAKATFWRFVEHEIAFARRLTWSLMSKNYRTEARILDEFGPHTLKKRSMKAGRKKKERQSNADPRRESLGSAH